MLKAALMIGAGACLYGLATLPSGDSGRVIGLVCLALGGLLGIPLFRDRLRKYGWALLAVGLGSVVAMLLLVRLQLNWLSNVPLLANSLIASSVVFAAVYAAAWLLGRVRPYVAQDVWTKPPQQPSDFEIFEGVAVALIVYGTFVEVLLL